MLVLIHSVETNINLFWAIGSIGGTVAREEVASAFLATLLEQRQDARNAFVDLVVRGVRRSQTRSSK